MPNAHSMAIAMAHPYQCLLHCRRTEQHVSNILIAASGSYIHTFNVVGGGHLFSWPHVGDYVTSPQCQKGLLAKPALETPKGVTSEDLQPPSKRPKILPRAATSTESSSAEIIVKSSDHAEGLHSNPVISLAATSEGHYVVAVTSEDKCIRVFELTRNGDLHQFSERVMPKRPCAVTITPDDSTILCADKFGDVYSLPLMGKPYEFKEVDCSLDGNSTKNWSKDSSPKFVPSATSLTVHTKKNLDALRQQQNSTLRKMTKPSLTFDYQLLLGHVSLLTDLVCASISINASKRREYILTSDRDEHIRVSRGIPQPHIIEGYCLGHTQFISKLCLIPSKPELLISGGGDDFLLLWDWLAGTVKQKIDLRTIVEEFKVSHFAEKGIENTHKGRVEVIEAGTENKLKIAVSNIKVLDQNRPEIIVTCEAIPAIFLFTSNEHHKVMLREAYPTERNVIDVVVLQDRGSVIYSMDNIHRPFSATEEDGDTDKRSLVEAIHFLQGPQRWEEDLNLDDALLPALDEYARSRNLVPEKKAAKRKSLKEMLYCLESLRKQRIGGDAVAEDIAENEEAE